jgi:hypothetical protein
LWEKENIEFHRMESSWCSSNMVEELKNIKPCLCGCIKEVEYLYDTSGAYLEE